MKPKKIIAILLALSLVMSLAACGGDSNSSSSQGSTSSAVGDTSSDSSESTSSTDQEPAAGEVTFRMAIVRWAESMGLAFSDTALLREATEATGVSVEWETYYGADWSEQKSLLLAGGNLPDAFFGSVALTDADVSQNKASLVELTDLISSEMPNLSKILDEDPMMKALCTDADGKIYSLPKKLPLRPVTANQMFINTKFLDALKMDMPDTYEELADFMIACAKEDPDGNGEADTMGQSIAISAAYTDMNNLLLPFGVQTSRVGNYMGMEDGKPVFMATTERFKEAVKWAHYLFENGALDPERFTQDSGLASAKVQAEGGSKVGVQWQWSVDSETGPNAADFEVCQAVKGPDGERYVESDPTYLNYGRRELIVTTACSDPAKLLQWADFFYQDLPSLQTYYGSIGDGKIEDKGDGTYEVLIPEDGTSLDASCWEWSFRDHGPKYMSEAFEKNIILPADQGDGVKLAANEIDLPNVHETFPTVSYTDEQNSTLTMLTTDIYNYINTTYADWVTNGGVDEGWDAYIAQLDAMGLPQVIEIQNDAYNTYIANN